MTASKVGKIYDYSRVFFVLIIHHKKTFKHQFFSNVFENKLGGTWIHVYVCDKRILAYHLKLENIMNFVQLSSYSLSYNPIVIPVISTRLKMVGKKQHTLLCI